jgi:hypothetical protein
MAATDTVVDRPPGRPTDDMTTPQHDREPSPGDEGAEAAVGGRTGAERSSPAPKEPPAVRQPVSFLEVDRAEAVEIATTVINAAAVIVGRGVDSYIFTRLTEHVIAEIASGGGASGVRVKVACDASRTGHSHLPEHYTDGWELTGALAVRLVPVITGRRVRFEHIYSHAAEISRDHNGLGTDHRARAPQRMHFIGDALGTVDTHTTSYAIPLLMGTRDDVNATTADGSRIQRFAAERDRSLPASWGQHLDELLMVRRELVRALRGRTDLPGRLKPLGIDPDEIGRGFSRTLVVSAMPFGPPDKRTRSSADLLIPADDATLISALTHAGGRALVFGGPLTDEGGRTPTAEELSRRGYREVPWDAGTLGEAFGLASMAPWNVEYRFSRREQTLLRIETGAGAWMESWRMIRFQESELPDAIALIERSLEDWPTHCLDRAYIDCAPGKLKADDLRSQNAWRGILRVADAALVAADRRMRQRHARS